MRRPWHQLRLAAAAVLLGGLLLSACLADRDAAGWGFLTMPCEGGAHRPQLEYEIVRVLPHDPAAYTQGLLIDGDIIFESTGLYGSSSLRKIARDSGQELARVALPQRLFGEGLALAHGRLYQLTWREGEVRIYQADDLQLLRTARIDGEGWGLAFDGSHLIQSDGSATLFFRNTDDLAEIRQVQVQANGRPVSGLNELEYVDGRVFANIYPTDCIVVINAADGQVLAWLDLRRLAAGVRQRWPAAEVTNGIAYDAATGTYYLTGKRWPELFELRLREGEGFTTETPRARREGRE